MGIPRQYLTLSVKSKNAVEVEEQIEEANPKAPFVFPSLEDFKTKRFGGFQKLLTRSRTLITQYDIFLDLDDEGKRRLLSASGVGAGGFLSALPVRADLKLKPLDFTDSVRYCLGIPTTSLLAIPCGTKCACNKVHDYTTPSDILSCNRSGASFWKRRHDGVARAFNKICKEALFSTKLELRTGEDTAARVDVTVFDFPGDERTKEGKVCEWNTVHFDVAVTDPTNASNSKHALRRASAADAKAQKKLSSPGAKEVQEPDKFVPAIVETYGLVHISLRKALNSIADCHIENAVKDSGLSAMQQGFLKGSMMVRYYQLISVALMKGVVENIRDAARHVHRCGRTRRKSPPLTTARAQGIIGAIQRFDSSGLAEFF